LDRFIEERLRTGTTKLYDEVLEQVERRLFARVLEETHGNQSRTAEILGITRGKVRDRITVFGIHMDRTISVDG
jgi:two-component system nitrogen regulation response regulator GlnG